MKISLCWPDCNASRFSEDGAGEQVDGFWCECDADEAGHLMTRIPISRKRLPEPERAFDQRDNPDAPLCYFFLVARDLSFAEAFDWHYPFHHGWNAYSPFRKLPQHYWADRLEDLQGITVPDDLRTQHE